MIKELFFSSIPKGVVNGFALGFIQIFPIHNPIRYGTKEQPFYHEPFIQLWKGEQGEVQESPFELLTGIVAGKFD